MLMPPGDIQERYTSVGYVMMDKHATIIVEKGKQIEDCKTFCIPIYM